MIEFYILTGNILSITRNVPLVHFKSLLDQHSPNKTKKKEKEVICPIFLTILEYNLCIRNVQRKKKKNKNKNMVQLLELYGRWRAARLLFLELDLMSSKIKLEYVWKLIKF